MLLSLKGLGVDNSLVTYIAQIFNYICAIVIAHRFATVHWRCKQRHSLIKHYIAVICCYLCYINFTNTIKYQSFLVITDRFIDDDNHTKLKSALHLKHACCNQNLICWSDLLGKYFHENLYHQLCYIRGWIFRAKKNSKNRNFQTSWLRTTAECNAFRILVHAIRIN